MSIEWVDAPSCAPAWGIFDETDLADLNPDQVALWVSSRFNTDGAVLYGTPTEIIAACQRVIELAGSLTRCQLCGRWIHQVEKGVPTRVVWVDNTDDEGCSGSAEEGGPHVPAEASTGRVLAVVTDEGTLVCGACGNDEFSYEEGCRDYRTFGGQSAEDQTVTVCWHSDGTADTGDDDPGLICDPYSSGGCGKPVDLPEGWDVTYT